MIAPVRTVGRLVVFSAALGLAGCSQESIARLPDQKPAAPPAVPTSKAVVPATPEAGTVTAVPSTEPVAAVSAAAAPGQLLLTGTTKAFHKSTLSPKVSGTVMRVFVRKGNEVRQGEAVIALDDRDFALALRNAEALEQTARAQLEIARLEWQRVSALLKDQAVAQSQFDKVDAQLKVATATLAQATVAVDKAKRDVANTVIRAPYAGVVSEVHIDVGAYATTMPPSALVTLEQISTLELDIEVPETAMAAIGEGTPITARFSSINKSMELKISRLVRSVDQERRSFSAIVVLDNADKSLRPGMFAEVRLRTAAQARREPVR